MLYLNTTDKFGQTSSASNLGSILINLKRYNESLQYSLIAKQGYENLGYEVYLPYPISNIACVYDSLHQYKTAEINYLKSIQLFEKYSNNFEISEISNLYSNCLNKQKKYVEGANLALKKVRSCKNQSLFLEIKSYKNLFDANIGMEIIKSSRIYCKNIMQER
ncbi:MAG: tetratricopeptide repeat protein [Flavobacterium sp.]|nr:tetratricopeptide repeat protein [Flavobacterium sp.]